MTPQDEDKIIEEAYARLLEGYLASNHRKKVEIIDKAFKFARDAHQGIRRRSGEPYILHPIAVATIVSQEIGLGSTSICSALLHDVVEDTEYTVEDIRAQFGDKIATIVDGLTKISGGIFGDKASIQAENFRKLLLTMSDDIRVVLIKMADRLHNMRTLASMPPQKQYKIAGETLYIYAPLAHRLGLFAIKTELEDLSFKYEHPEIHARISEQIAASEQHRNEIFARFAAPIRERLDKLGLKYEFRARVKSCYSIWKKMEKKHIPFDEVYDLYAARIVFECGAEADEKRICWMIYSEITDLYRLHPDRVRDWISTPKANGYRALHITVMGPDGNWVEVQIRSRRMDDIAERGFAAHWKYKIGEGEEESELAVWLKTIEDILKNPEPNALDFLDTIKLNLFASEIVVFTPAGEIVTLPADASVLDFAFTLHSQIGTHCIAGKVNHKLVPLSHKLASGDQVEVLTSHSQQPQPEWEKFLVTAKGKTRLRSALRHQRRLVIDRGERLLTEFFEQNGVELTHDNIARIITSEHAGSKDDLFRMIGAGEIALGQQQLNVLRGNRQGGLLNRLLRNPFASKEKGNSDTVTTVTGEKIDTKKVYELTTTDGQSNYTIADCCHPIPGDDVVGYVDDDNKVVVHKLDCPVAMRLKSSYGSRLVQTRWETKSEKFLAAIRVEGIDRMGILQEIIYIISTTMAINMRRLNISADDGLFRCDLVVLVEDANVITNLCKRLKRVKGVKIAERT
ncbi:MAG: bifunctional (p)ppGpp synthetase/guanosine-3',5'-bis(diphosphate) 3'-pyrophosphohydrolase [Muribaculaceae bacterium]|jgi:GTP pyrophosphokinase|nr:bifunctional (p)ppGpp synthetase/guanosine-3',5'-bis(diphosphate) 3'-pyrophosphohydrolase [Muribaculaceae bacterium]